MAIFTNPTSFQNANAPYHPSSLHVNALASNFNLQDPPNLSHNVFVTTASPSPSLPHLTLLVFEAVLEVVCVSLPGYLAARQGMFDTEAQKFVANLNVTLFTPCLIFTKLASQLTAKKLTDLAIIPVIFIVQTIVSYTCSAIISRCFRFKKRQANFVTAMAVFANSNSLPISLVISLSQTLSGLHWDQIPNDNDDEVAARGILYLLIFQQLGQLVRWSWGYHVLLAPKHKYAQEEEETAESRIERGAWRYSDNPEDDNPNHSTQTLIGIGSDDDPVTPSSSGSAPESVRDNSPFESQGQTPVGSRQHSYLKLPSMEDDDVAKPHLNVNGHPITTNGHLTTFADVAGTQEPEPPKGFLGRCGQSVASFFTHIGRYLQSTFQRLFGMLPLPLQKFGRAVSTRLGKFLSGLWQFMNPPLWAMLVAVVVASIPELQRLFFDEGTFVSNSVTRAVQQSGNVAVPLILVVLGANLARNTLPKEATEDLDDPSEERKLIIASLISRMVFPTLIMAPLMAFTAKYVSVSILNDPIFVVVCFLLMGAPSALQLAQICQLNNVFMGAMSSVLFQSYVVWILPSTLVLVMCALQVVQWATA
ncbi:hypothetical protein FQN54_001243 [Arachnomyces sp. PD_36]|nr:hypothetical protein FQN54_001243 [Arachnomyces sp. PD_36]